MTSEHRFRRVLFGLVAATIFSTALTLPVVGLHHQPSWTATVFAIALVKARFVVATFMELRDTWMMKAFDLWLAALAAAYVVLLQ